MLRLNSLSNISNLSDKLELASGMYIKPLSYTIIKMPNNPINELQMILLSSELLYQAKLSLDSGNFGKLDYKRIFTARKLLKQSNDILNNIYSMQDMNALCKELKVKNILRSKK